MTTEEDSKLSSLLHTAKASASAVPNAPFKTTWPELALKRMIRYAAENGYDKIAWTPGEVQAARYDLSKQVKSIQASRMADDTFHIGGIDKDGKVFTLGTGIAEKDLAANVGKDLAEKMRGQQGTKTYHGVDLKVGGEGMAGFYDQILPAAANKLTKKFGAKVNQAKIENRDPNRRDMADPGTISVHNVDITPALRDAAVGNGFPLFAAGIPIPSDQNNRYKLVPVDHDPFAPGKVSTWSTSELRAKAESAIIDSASRLPDEIPPDAILFSKGINPSRKHGDAIDYNSTDIMLGRRAPPFPQNINFVPVDHDPFTGAL